MAESTLMPTDNLGQEVGRQLQVSLRAGEADVSQVCGEQRQHRAEVHVLLKPAEHAQGDVGVPQIVDAQASARRRSRNVGQREDVRKGVMERREGIGVSLRPGKERTAVVGVSKQPFHVCAAPRQACSEIAGNGHEPTLAELRLADAENRAAEVDVATRQAKRFAGAQPRQQQEGERRP